MKKTSALLLLLCLFAVAKAQLSVSTNLSYNNSNYSYSEKGQAAFDRTLPQGFSLAFAPRVGYTFANHLTLGIDLGFGYSDIAHTDGFYNPNTMEWEQSELQQEVVLDANAGLFVRKRLFAWGSLSLHAEGGIGYGMGFGTHTLTQYAYNSWGVLDRVVTSHKVRTGRFALQLVPVFNYAFSRHFSMDAYLDFASLVFTSETRTLFGEKSELSDGSQVYSHTVTNDFNIGVRSLTTRLLTLGFSYTF